MFSSALQSGQLGPLMQQFGFDSEVAQAAARGGGCTGQKGSQLSFVPRTRDQTLGAICGRH